MGVCPIADQTKEVVACKYKPASSAAQTRFVGFLEQYQSVFFGLFFKIKYF